VRADRRGALLCSAVALLGASPAPAAPETITTELARCVTMASSEARLACYDALAGRSAKSSASSAAPGASASVHPVPAAGTPAAVAPAAAAAMVAPAPAPAPVPVPVAPPDPAEAAKNFGLSSTQLHSAPQGPQAIEAHVTKVTVDQAFRNYVVLDNGQTWASTDGDLQLDSGERVTIKRAALGSFMLVSTTSKHSYHVRRVR
jgi:hypothetical protein